MATTDIHLVKAAFKKQFEITMSKNGVSADDYFKKVNLPATELDPESLLPEKPFWHLINMVALEENIADFGSQVAQTTPWHRVSSLAPLIQHCLSLKHLLETFCEITLSQSSATRFTLEEHDSHYTFSYDGLPLYKHDIQMELYRVTCMIQLVQLSTGKDWRPEQISLMMPQNTTLNACGLIKKSKRCFSNKTTSITINRHLLHLPVRLESNKKNKIVNPEKADLNADFVNSIREIMSSYILDKHCSIEDISSIAGISVRTLQRRLTQHNLKFNELLSQAKFICAKEKLQDTEIQISEIASSLGYSDAANFTRAFHRWAGVSPKVFRQGCSRVSMSTHTIAV